MPTYIFIMLDKQRSIPCTDSIIVINVIFCVLSDVLKHCFH